MRRTFPFLAVALLTLGFLAPHPAQARQADGEEAALTGVTQISAGGRHTCARMTNGTARCWGSNYDGEAGTGTVDQPTAPVQTVRNITGTGPLTGIRSIEVGTYHTCALLTSGQVRCWGYNGDGQVGNGSANDQIGLPRTVTNANGTPLSGVTQIALGHRHSCALLGSGQVRCWGENSEGELGDGTAAGTPRPRPRVVLAAGGSGPLTGVTQIDAGRESTCARLSNGRVRCWGDNGSGQLGTGDTTDRPFPTVVEVAGGASLQNVTQVAIGGRVACARVGTARVLCWGSDDEGALGNGTDGASSQAVPVKNLAGGGPLTGVATVDFGEDHGCARLANAQGRCWGRNLEGELGDGSISSNQLPRVVQNVAGDGPLTGIRQLRTGELHTCALLTIGQVRCWGYNNNGQVGDNSVTTRQLPVPVRLP